MRGGVGARLAASPVMVGAVTVLIAILAVFLAYNANSGLPFVPTYRISAQVPNAEHPAAGQRGADRRRPRRRDRGRRADPGRGRQPSARKLDLSLDADTEPLPVDSTILVRARSALGPQVPGDPARAPPSEGFPEGAIMPPRAPRGRSRSTSTRCCNTFDDPTRIAIQDNLVEFGNALAGRGPTLNLAIGQLRPLLPRLERVTTNLGCSGDPARPLLLRRSATPPARSRQSPPSRRDMFVALDTTFTSLASVARPFIQETISESPPTLDVGTETLPRIRPFLDHSASLFTELQPGIESLRANADTIASALEVGAPVLAASPELNRQLAADRRRAATPQRRPRRARRHRPAQPDREHPRADARLPHAVADASATTRRWRCATWRASSRQGNGTGTWQRFIVFDPPDGPNSEGLPAAAAANGGEPAPPEGVDRNYLHYNPYPNTAAPGQERRVRGRQRGLPPGAAGDRQRPRQPGDRHGGARTDESRGRTSQGPRISNWVLGLAILS